MIHQIALLGAAALAVFATSASAQQTQTYTYDVHGRLIRVIRTTGSTSQATTYALDKADNRTNRDVTAPTSTLMRPPREQMQGQDAAEPQATFQEAQELAHISTGRDAL